MGRRILGPFADQASVDALNQQLGTDRPLITQYLDWITSFLTGDFGTSARDDRPVSEVLGDPLVASLKLAVLAFIIVVPLAIWGGVVAALHEGGKRDRLISVGGLSATAIPEFVWAVLFIIVFALGLGLFPTTAQFPDGSSVFTQLKYLLLPALCLVCVLFGYIARMARAGTIEALDADYTRTATLKGLPQRTVIRRHVLRNSLLPTIAVVATQAGLPDRRAGHHRGHLQLPGHRPDAVPGRHPEGHPGAAERRPDHRHRLPRRDAHRRHPLLRPQPPRPPGSSGMSVPGATDVGPSGAAALAAAGDDARMATRERFALLKRSKSFIAGAVIVGFWVLCAVFGELLVPEDPTASDPINDLLAPSADHWFGTDKLGRDVFSRVITGARDILIVAPIATILATALGTALGLVTGYFRGTVDDVLSRIVEAFLALPVIIMGLLVAVAVGPSRLDADPDHRAAVRADHLAHRARRRAGGAGDGVRLRGAAAQRAHARTSCSARSCPTSPVRSSSSSPSASATPSSSPPACRSSASASSRPRRTGACRWRRTTASSPAASGGPVLFPSLAIATLVIGVNLIADGVASAFER